MTNRKKYNLDIKIRLRTEKKLNVGGAYTIKSRAEVPFQRILLGDKEYLYIPGSTLKGVLRTSLIKIAGTLGFKNVSWRVSPESLAEADPHDIVIRLFGRPHDMKSKVFIDPIYLSSDTQTLTHVRIDDKFGVCEEGALYTVEYLPIGIEFETVVSGRGLDIEEARALFSAILEMRFERIGKAGIVDVKIIREESRIPRELAEDKFVKSILEEIGV